MSAATGILTAWPTLPSVSPSRKIMSMSLSTACARSCPARHTALLVPLRRGRRPRRPALPRSLCPSVGATLAVARGRGRAPPLCTPRNAPSRADRVVRPYKPYPHAILMMVGRQHFTDTQQKMLPTCFGGKNPPAFTYASAPELLFHPYTAANTSGS